jgi:hypothetical protein
LIGRSSPGWLSPAARSTLLTCMLGISRDR